MLYVMAVSRSRAGLLGSATPPKLSTRSHDSDDHGVQPVPRTPPLVASTLEPLRPSRSRFTRPIERKLPQRPSPKTFMSPVAWRCVRRVRGNVMKMPLKSVGCCWFC